MKKILNHVEVADGRKPVSNIIRLNCDDVLKNTDKSFQKQLVCVDMKQLGNICSQTQEGNDSN